MPFCTIVAVRPLAASGGTACPTDAAAAACRLPAILTLPTTFLLLSLVAFIEAMQL